jgi:LacI family transcriptional regulator
MPKARSRVATSHDVARLAGVSRALVSGVLNGTMSTMRVSPETRQRVLDAAAELGYSPHPLARALRQQRSNVYGYLPRATRRNPYEHPVPFLLGVHLAKAAIQHGLHILEASAETTAAHESGELVRFLRDRRVDGVILDSPRTTEEVEQFLDYGLPVIQLIRPLTSVPTPAIIVDPKPGITAAIEHLLALGHRAIAFIGIGGDHPVDRARLNCFRAALVRAGVVIDPEHVRLVDDYEIGNGLRATEDLLALSSRPTAIFASGDNIALGALQALYRANVRIPDDLSLVSYDDIYAAHLAPPLASVRQPLDEIAEQAIGLLARRPSPDGEEAAPEPIMLPTKFTPRGSTGPA